MSRLVGIVVDDGIEHGRDHDADTTAHDRASTRRAAAVVVALHAAARPGNRSAPVAGVTWRGRYS
ncbi:MAG: hypothetical protein V9E94_02030 [Microthrixaceae bacterium]